jgi:hypothetical protein
MIPLKSPDLISQIFLGLVAVILYYIIAWLAIKQFPAIRNNRNGLWFAIGCSVALVILDFLWIMTQ